MHTAEKQQNKKKIKHASQGMMIWKRFRKNKLAVLGLIMLSAMILLCLIGSMLIDYSQVVTQVLSESYQSPNKEHLFGTDMFGRDLLARMVYGGITSLSCGLATVVCSLILAVLFGSTAGYFGGWIDTVLMRIIDAFNSIPFLLLSMVLVIAIGQSTLTTVVAIGIASFPAMARLIRSSVMTLRSSEYVDAAKCYGVKWYSILLRHVLPNGIGPLIVQSTLQLGGSILAISTLGFLGLGVPSPKPEWGTILSEVRDDIRWYPYLGIIPGAAIAISVLSINFIGDGLRDALDPRTKK